MEDGSDSFVETITASSSNNINRDLFLGLDDDDDSFIPESLKGFLEAADAKLQADLDDVLKSDSKSKPSVRKDDGDAALAVLLHDDNDDDDGDLGTNAMLMDMHKAEEEEKAALQQKRMIGDDDILQQVISDDDDDDERDDINPAANLTAGQAKDQAMDGMSPQDQSFDIKATRLEYPMEDESPPPPLEKATPSPTKKPKFDDDDDDDDKPTPEQERSYISSSSEDDEAPKPVSPPAIIYNHQQRGPPPPSPEVPSSSELLQQALQMQREINAKMSPSRDAAPNSMKQEEPQNAKAAASPPVSKTVAPAEASASPSGMVGNLLEYLHPTNNNNSKKARRKPESKPQQLFKVKKPPMKREKLPVSVVSIPVSSSPAKDLRQKRQQHLHSPMSSTTSTARRNMGHSPLASPRPRRQLTAPDNNIPSRLLKGTSASQAKGGRQKPKPEQVSSSTTRGFLKATKASSTKTGFMKATQASSIHMASSKVETAAHAKDHPKPDQKAKARIRARMQYSSSNRKALKPQQKEKVKSTLDRVRERRVRLERMEQERVAKLKADIDEREKNAKERRERLAKEKKLASPPLRKPRKSLPPTVPKTPIFYTDSRLQKREAKDKKEVVPLAASNDVLMKSFREDTSVGAATGERKLTIPKTPNLQTTTRAKAHDKEPAKKESVPLASSNEVLMRSFREDQSVGSATGERKMTIPKTPKFIMTKKYGDKSDTVAAAGDGDDDSVGQWQNGLRSVTSPSNFSTSSGLTLPKSPNFQPTRRRELPKSTAEKEQEEMEYYKAHPFKAIPNEMNKRSLSRSKNDVKPSQLTVPKPFSFSSSRKRSSAEKKKEEKPTVKPFKARPAPSFPAPSGTPVSGFTMKTKRALTNPAPFKLSSSKRPVNSPPASSEQQKEYKFRARKVPASLSSGPPRSITLRTTTSRRQSHEPEKKEKKFRARPMPKFDKVSIAVVSKNPNKLRSPPAMSKEENSNPFRAKGVPKFLSKPSSIPVRKRDPTKLRSPDYVKTTPQFATKENGGTHRLSVSPEPVAFKAKAAPMNSPPDIPVQGRDPTRLRNSPSKLPSPSRNFHSRPAPYRSPPALPVRHRDPLKLRASPVKQPDRGLPGPPSLAGSSSTSSEVAMQPRVDKKKAVRENLRQRMKGKAVPKKAIESFATEEESNFGASVESSMDSSGEGSNYEGATIETDLAQAENKAGDANNKNAQLKSDLAQADAKIHSANQKIEQLKEATGASLLRNAMNKWPQGEEAAAGNLPEQKTPEAKGSRDTSELRVAMGGWLCDAIATTPRTGNAPAKGLAQPKAQKKNAIMSDTRRLEQEAFMVHDPSEFVQEQSRSKLFEETTRLAVDLQRAVEDELSFEASLNSKDNLDEGFIGQPSHGQFSL